MNTAPILLEDRVLPRPSREPLVADIGEDCVHAKFSVTPLDYDGDPRLHGKWILHPAESERFTLKEEEVLPTQIDVAQLLGGDVPGALVYRDFELELTRESLIGNGPGLVGPSTHLLELYVADRRFGSGLTNVEPVVGEGETPALVAHASWLIRLAETDCSAAE